MSQEKKSNWKWCSIVVAFAVLFSAISTNSAQAQAVPVSQQALPSEGPEVGVLPVALGLAAVTCAVAVAGAAYVWGLVRGQAKCKRQAQNPPPPKVEALAMDRLLSSEGTLD